MKKTLVAISIVALAFTGCAKEVSPAHHEASSHHKHWNYEENGPAHWEEFSKTCGIGHSQSPINIVSDKTVKMDSKYTLNIDTDVNTIAKVIDNGHSIKITPEKAGTITFNGETFKLLQFHFHGKSEHTVDGKQYDMVVHMVHQNPKTKQYAVVAVFFKKGKASPILDKIINNVGNSVELNPKDLLPEDTSDYYHYVGSFTTPPCTENVQWYLLKTPQTASAQQIEHFRKYYTDNERPVQKLYDRTIESN